MKRVLTTCVVAVVAALALSACGPDNKQPTTKYRVPAVTASPKN